MIYCRMTQGGPDTIRSSHYADFPSGRIFRFGYACTMGVWFDDFTAISLVQIRLSKL